MNTFQLGHSLWATYIPCLHLACIFTTCLSRNATSDMYIRYMSLLNQCEHTKPNIENKFIPYLCMHAPKSHEPII